MCLHVDMAGITQFVEVKPDAEIIIPDIAGENNVNQLRHHLDIQRMSKSKGNVVNPDELVEAYGADVMRCYLMFNFDWQKGGPWNESNIKGPQGWLNDVWKIAEAGAPSTPPDAAAERDIERKLHQTIAVVNRGLGRLQLQYRHRRTDEIQERVPGGAAGGGNRRRDVAFVDESDDPFAGAFRAPYRGRNVGAPGLGIQRAYAAMARI